MASSCEGDRTPRDRIVGALGRRGRPGGRRQEGPEARGRRAPRSPTGPRYPTASRDGAGASPTLKWKDVPRKTVQLAVIVHDPDAPGRTFVHWVIWGIDPKAGQIVEETVPPGVVQGANGAATTPTSVRARRAAPTRTTTGSRSTALSDAPRLEAGGDPGRAARRDQGHVLATGAPRRHLRATGVRLTWPSRATRSALPEARHHFFGEEAHRSHDQVVVHARRAHPEQQPLHAASRSCAILSAHPSGSSNSMTFSAQSS